MISLLGGLSEGFNSPAAPDHGVKFSSVLSIEKDPTACATLRLRSFFHQFSPRPVPEEYYKVVRGEIPEAHLSRFSEWGRASRQVWRPKLAGCLNSWERWRRVRREDKGVPGYRNVDRPFWLGYALSYRQHGPLASGERLVGMRNKNKMLGGSDGNFQGPHCQRSAGRNQHR